MKRGNHTNIIIAGALLIASAIAGKSACAGELESFSMNDICGKNRNSAFRKLEKLNDDLGIIKRAADSYAREAENSKEALDHWQKRKERPLERMLLGPDTQGIEQNIQIASAKMSHAERRKQELEERATENRRLLSLMDQVINGDQCPWASKKRNRDRYKAVFITPMPISDATSTGTGTGTGSDAAGASEQNHELSLVSQGR